MMNFETHASRTIHISVTAEGRLRQLMRGVQQAGLSLELNVKSGPDNATCWQHGSLPEAPAFTVELLVGVVRTHWQA